MNTDLINTGNLTEMIQPKTAMTNASNDHSANLQTPPTQGSTDAPEPDAVSLSADDYRVPEDWNYESTVHGIEQIIESIEMGEMEMAEIFDQFAIAVEQLHQCESFLTYHRQQVDLLIETLSDEPGGS
jgi:exodeoxyribonuclease VII small subunit